MKKIFKKVKMNVRAFFYAIGISGRAMKKTWKDTMAERNYLSILTKEERNEWFERVYNSHLNEEYLIVQCKLIRKTLEDFTKVNAA